MKVFRGYHDATISKALPSCVFAIGNFDGVHRGHLALLERAQALADKYKVGLGVYSFWPHPAQILRPHQPPSLICTQKQKHRLLSKAGVDVLVEEPFGLELAKLPAQQFATQILHHTLHARAVVVGADFRFGQGAHGTAEALQRWLVPLGVHCELVSKLEALGAPCSSTRIRAMIADGQVDKAAVLLGRFYALEGEVVEGDGRGRSIGMPTANLRPSLPLFLGKGVYATLIRLDGHEKPLAALTNVGVRPTFRGDDRISVETHVLDFDASLYGQNVELLFVEKLRDERRFDDAQSLLKQIAEDKKKALTSTAFVAHYQPSNLRKK